MYDIDAAEARLKAILPALTENVGSIDNEAETRLKIIDRMLFEVLGWEVQETKPEQHVPGGFVDYVLSHQGRARLVVEAKSVNERIVDTASSTVTGLKVSGSAMKSAEAGIEQASRYCVRTGTQFSLLTNGRSWIGYWASRDDGHSPFDGKAIVFPDLNSVVSSFAKFYECFAPETVIREFFKSYVQEAEGAGIMHAEILHPATKPSEAVMVNRTSLSRDLERVFNAFFKDISGPANKEMLVDCFVESNESIDAQHQMEKLSNNLINNIGMLDSDEGDELEAEIKSALYGGRGEFVLIVGNKGSGKTTFIDRFFEISMDRAIKAKCVILRVDLADADQDIDKLEAWISERLKSQLQAQMFGTQHPTYEQLQGVFYGVYQGWQRGEHKHLYNDDKKEFKKKFGDYMARVREFEVGKYIARLLQNCAKSRKLLPCLVFDNTDHYPRLIQERIFQFAQSLFRSTLSFIICPITDRTIWQLSKSGPLQSYDFVALYLPPPPVKEVVERRLKYVKQKMLKEKNTSSEFLSSGGIRIKLENLENFAACIEEVLLKTEFVMRTISWLCNLDIRRTLQFSQRVLTSGLLNVDSLIKTYTSGSTLKVSHDDIRRSIVCGGYTNFRQDQSDLVLNLFEVSGVTYCSPLLRISILQCLKDRASSARSDEEAYVDSDSIVDYLSPCGYSKVAIRSHLQTLKEYRLAEPYEPIDNANATTERYRISKSGLIHLELADNGPVYMECMALVTPLRLKEVAIAIRDIWKSRRNTFKYDAIVRDKFCAAIINEDARLTSIPASDSYDGQRLVRTTLARRWIGQ